MNTKEEIMSLQEKLSTMKQESIATKPPEIITPLLEETKKLVDSGIDANVIKKGQPLPHFSLSDSAGAEFHSEEVLKKGPMAISFYRGVWWPYCNVELEALQEIYDEVSRLGGSIISISPQLGKYTKQVVKKNNLTFPVLVDTDNSYAEKLGLVFSFPAKMKEIYLSLGLDLSRFNGNDLWQLPLAGRFLVDGNGIIQDVNVHADHTVRPEPKEIVEFMKKS